MTFKQKVNLSFCDFQIKGQPKSLWFQTEKKLKVVPVKACRKFIFLQKNKPTVLKSCGTLSSGFATLYQMKSLLRICFLHIKDLSAKKYTPFLGMRMKWHSMNKDPWLISHRIFLGGKIDLQVNGIFKNMKQNCLIP